MVDVKMVAIRSGQPRKFHVWTTSGVYGIIMMRKKSDRKRGVCMWGGTIMRADRKV